MLKKGFTLIEMLIVMAVVSILIAIIIPSYRGMQQDAWIAKAEKELQTMQAAVESYYRHNDKYPENLNDLTTASPRILTKLLDDPWKTIDSGSAKYTYGYFTGETSNFGPYYVLYSKSIDGTDNTINRGPEGNPPVFYVDGDDIVLSNLPVEKRS